jgi:DNA-binding NtrC family response regulator
MAGGLLRPDLYYRLSSSSIHLPPLRERADDIPLLAAHYLRLLAGHAPSGGEAHPHLTERALDLLVAQPWPGNVRELFNVLDEAWSMRGGADLDVGDLPVGPRREPAEPAPALSPLDAAERALIERTLRDTGGNKVKAARRLGISRTSLYAKLARYRLTATVRPL